jgi:hypothetical protein
MLGDCFFHFLLGSGAGHFRHFISHLFKKLLKSSRLADEDQLGLGIRCVRPGVRDVACRPRKQILRSAEYAFLRMTV